jgi:hypothetical protein
MVGRKKDFAAALMDLLAGAQNRLPEIWDWAEMATIPIPVKMVLFQKPMTLSRFPQPSF